MASLAEIKQIASLRYPKFRQKYGQFVVEGRKGVDEVFHSNLKVVKILLTATYLTKFGKPNCAENLIEQVSEKEMDRMSQMDTPPGILAWMEIPPAFSKPSSAPFYLVLDGISDPSNLGAILRIADWYGLSQVILSQDCTDEYNLKCVTASMGSFTRVKCIRLDLGQFLSGISTVYGALLNGQSIYEASARIDDVELPQALVIGSESHGIRENLMALINHPVTIPRIGGAESLNASVATGILLDRFLGK
jgi:TrmH family RNA methyltransferase